MTSVLIVDDSKFMARAMQSMLQGLGFDVVGVAHDGHDGLAQFKAHHPDVTLLDITMPNMDGVECLGHIMKLVPDARVVMLSAVRDKDTVDHCLQTGASAFLQKPIRPDNDADVSRLSETLESVAARPV